MLSLKEWEPRGFFFDETAELNGVGKCPLCCSRHLSGIKIWNQAKMSSFASGDLFFAGRGIISRQSWSIKRAAMAEGNIAGSSVNGEKSPVKQREE